MSMSPSAFRTPEKLPPPSPNLFRDVSYTPLKETPQSLMKASSLAASDKNDGQPVSKVTGRINHSFAIINGVFYNTDKHLVQPASLIPKNIPRSYNPNNAFRCTTFFG